MNSEHPSFRIFKRPLPLLLPVVHVSSVEQAVRMASMAAECGSDGVWLICHGGDPKVSRSQLLIDAFAACREKLPDFWIGINNLQMIWHPEKTFEWVAEHMPTCDGIWADQCFALASCDTQKLREVAQAKEKSGWKGVYFGGIAFKYQPALCPNQDTTNPKLLGTRGREILKNSAKSALPFVDVLTTSGTATGAQAPRPKIEALGSVAKPLAVSGCGMTWPLYADCADVFLAATALQPACAEHGVVDKCQSSFCAFDRDKLLAWLQPKQAAYQSGNDNGGGGGDPKNDEPSA